MTNRWGRLVIASLVAVGFALVPGMARAQTPTITGFSPPAGPVGATVTISGTGLSNADSVDFDGASATPATVSETELTAIVPTGAKTGPLTVHTTEGSATSLERFVVQPNIVLILTDDQRFDEIANMPTVQNELVGKGTTFSNAFVVNPLCCPSRTTILTGKYSHSTGVYANRPPNGGFDTFHALGEESSTIATWLQAAGYNTGLVGKYLNGYVRSDAAYIPPGWNTWDAYVGSAAGFYYNYPLSIQGTTADYGSTDTGDPSTTDYSTDRLSWYATNFITSASPQNPMFLYFATSAPHAPDIPAARYGATPNPCFDHATPPSYNEADVSDKPPYVATRPLLGAQRQSLLKPCRTLMAVDDAVGSILGALDQTGRLESTLILFMSDNGVVVGEHRLLGKQVPYESSIRVPMIVRYDPVTNGVASTRSELALNVDVAPTFADVAGVTAPGVEGTSLLPLVRGESGPWRTDFLIEHTGGASVPTYCAVRGERYKYVEYSDGFQELYDLENDPYELNNLMVTDPSNPEVIAERDLMYSRMLSLCQPPPPGFTP